MKECPKCHAQIEEDAVFCTNCGINQDPINFMTEEEKKDHYLNEEKKESVNTVILGIITLVSSIIAGGLFWMLLTLEACTSCVPGSKQSFTNEWIVCLVLVLVFIISILLFTNSRKKMNQASLEYNRLTDNKDNLNKPIDNDNLNKSIDNDNELPKDDKLYEKMDRTEKRLSKFIIIFFILTILLFYLSFVFNRFFYR